MGEENFITQPRTIIEPKECGCGKVCDFVAMGTKIIEGWCMVRCDGCESVRPVRFRDTIPLVTN